MEEAMETDQNDLPNQDAAELHKEPPSIQGKYRSTDFFKWFLHFILQEWNSL